MRLRIPPEGAYEVTAVAPGFKRYFRTGITVQVAQTSRIDITMGVGTAAKSVTVEASLLKTESGGISSNVEVQTLDQINARNRIDESLTSWKIIHFNRVVKKQVEFQLWPSDIGGAQRLQSFAPANRLNWRLNWFDIAAGPDIHWPRR